MKTMVLALAAATLVAGCGNNGRDAAAERMEDAAEANAAAAGPTPVALGLSEAQLLDADLIGPNNVEIGEVQSLVRNASGAVEGLIVEVEDTNPDRYVQIPLTGLNVVQRGDDRDLSTTMTRDQPAGRGQRAGSGTSGSAASWSRVMVVDRSRSSPRCTTLRPVSGIWT